MRCLVAECLDYMMEVGQSDTYYESYWSEEGFHPGSNLTPELRHLLESNIPPGARTLDVGCGDARTAGTWALEHGRGYVGVDVSAVAVASARRRGLDVRTISTATSLPFDDNEFDAALCIEVLEHLFAPAQAAGEILRVLKPSGVLLATVPNVAYWRRRLELAFGRWNPLGDGLSVEQPWRDPHIRFFSVSTLGRMLASAGFERLHVSGHEGIFLGDLPLLNRRRGSRQSSRTYKRLEQRVPALLANRLHVVAHKPAGRGEA
jgi:ubiquinone/menaquinone biosynthesis C-methylase UbiE